MISAKICKNLGGVNSQHKSAQGMIHQLLITVHYFQCCYLYNQETQLTRS